MKNEKDQLFLKKISKEVFYFLIFKILTSVFCIVFIYKKKNLNIGKNLSLSKVIEISNHSLIIYFTLLTMVLFSSIFTAYRYAKNNKAVKEINELSLYLSVIYSAYLLFFISPSSQTIDINSPHFYSSTLFLNILGQIFAITSIFTKVFITFIDINDIYNNEALANEKNKSHAHNETQLVETSSILNDLIKLSLLILIFYPRKK